MAAGRLKRWGHSLAFVVPKEVVRKKGLREGDLIEVSIERVGTPFQELFGTLKTRKTTRQLLREAREGEDED